MPLDYAFDDLDVREEPVRDGSDRMPSLNTTNCTTSDACTATCFCTTTRYC